MDENEVFGDFNAKLSAIVNSSFYLGEVIPEHKIVKKILRSLPERFDPKVVAIKETNNLDSLKADQLIGNLQTFEANLRSTKKAKGMALVSSKSRLEHDDGSESDTENPELDAFFVKKFKKFMKDDKGF
eukprot:TRINITY_DN3454_c2_g3_i1.p2 TRINITY_DN3454_c2_g3~~TRINITY_DN3454_c2_g3_i1.p2  ORF type:complete len:129 (-),score=33.31 TRINITY_DN3454_c2_g3_i1:3075-3461(-)